MLLETKAKQPKINTTQVAAECVMASFTWNESAVALEVNQTGKAVLFLVFKDRWGEQPAYVGKYPKS